MKTLTEREHTVAYFIVQGLKNKEIAEKLSISVSTVKSELENIYEKTGCHNRVQLAVFYLMYYEKFSEYE